VLNNIDLKGMRVAITGGTSGLGLALVRNLAASRARVAFVARGAQLVERVSKETRACGIVGDVGVKEDIHATALEIAWSLGGLDVLINNASSLGPAPLKLLADTECEELQEALAVNMPGPFRLTSIGGFPSTNSIAFRNRARRRSRPRSRGRGASSR
jgi:NAD(P)-dependent dehydrogenase (short-subunit alcohol dehydrogenase family)